MSTPYEDHLLGAPDACSNCFRLVRVERLDPTRSGFESELQEHYERCRQTTTIEFAPSDAPPRSKGVFCECGVEGARERLWSAEHVTRGRFKQLLANAVRTLEAKDVSLKRKETLAYGLHAYDEGSEPDEAIAEAVEMGIVAEAASEEDRTKQTAD